MPSDSKNGDDPGDGANSDVNNSEPPPQGIVDTLDTLRKASAEQSDERISVGEIVDAFGSRAYGPLLLLPALLALFPLTGGIPGASIVLATCIIAVCVQMLFLGEGLWTPKWLARITVSKQKLEAAVDRGRWYAGYIDALIVQRFEVLAGKPAQIIAALVCIALAVCMYPLALVPLGVAPPAAAIAVLALAMTARDGVLMSIGLLGAIG